MKEKITTMRKKCSANCGAYFTDINAHNALGKIKIRVCLNCGELESVDGV